MTNDRPPEDISKWLGWLEVLINTYALIMTALALIMAALLSFPITRDFLFNTRIGNIVFVFLAFIIPVSIILAIPPVRQALRAVCGRITSLLGVLERGLRFAYSGISATLDSARRIVKSRPFASLIIAFVLGLIAALIILPRRGIHYPLPTATYTVVAKGKLPRTLTPTRIPVSPATPMATTIPTPGATSVSTATPTPTYTPVPPTVIYAETTTSTPTKVDTTTPIPVRTPTSTATRTTIVPGKVAVPDAVVHQFFSPGPQPAALAVAGDILWVADEEQRRLYQLDRTGTALASFPITPTGTIRGLAWDGETLHLALSSYQGAQVVRLDTDGTVLGSFPLPVAPIGLGWNPIGGTLWTVSHVSGKDFLLEFNTDGRLLQIYFAYVFGSVETLTWSPDGLWAVNSFSDLYNFSFAGEKLHSYRLPKNPSAVAWDERGYLWLVGKNDRHIYQLSLHQVEVRATSTPMVSAELALPRPQLESVPTIDGAIAHVANNLQGTLSLSFGDESVILDSGQTWSAELDPGVYTVFASATVPKPIAFSGVELLVRGYEYTWSLAHSD